MVLGILLTLFLVFLNGFFVAAEFAIVKVRYSQIQLKAEQGNRLAQTAEYIIRHLDSYLSATQLGITLASLGLGWIGEAVVADIIHNVLSNFHIELAPETEHTIGFVVAFSLITVLHIVLGELAPKSIAIRKSESTTLAIALPLRIFFTVFKPFIWLMNSMSNALLKLIGIEPAGEHEIHSNEELQLLVKQSKEGGAIQEENYEIIKNAFDFNDHNAREVMVPRQQVFALDAELPVREMMEQIIENRYSRIPVYQDTMDNIIGILFTKEVFKAYFHNQEFKVKELLQPAHFVIETKSISDLMADFQKRHIHMAVVIDEFGGMEGIVTLEDILEELVGEIQDEDDDERPVVEHVADDLYIVQATQPLEDINEFLPMPLPESDQYHTLSGLILDRLNRIPRANDKIALNDYELTILRMQGRAIHTVQLRDLKRPEGAPAMEPKE